jgi:hypothetical protein
LLSLDRVSAGLAFRVLHLAEEGALPSVLQLEPDTAVAAVPSDGIQRRGIGIAQDLDRAAVERRLCAGPTRIFPLRLARQLETPVGFRQAVIQCLEEGLRILPAYSLDRAVG